jgi:hypothetical protein
MNLRGESFRKIFPQDPNLCLVYDSVGLPTDLSIVLLCHERSTRSTLSQSQKAHRHPLISYSCGRQLSVSLF